MIKLGLDAGNISIADTKRLVKDLNACSTLNTIKSLRQYIKYHDTSLKQMISDKKAVQKSITEKRKPKPKRFSDNWVAFENRRYCLCKKTYTRTDPAMVQCENCSEWYHYPCILGDTELPDDLKDEDITFVCGIGNCTKRQSCFVIQSGEGNIEYKFKPEVFKHNVAQEAAQVDQEANIFTNDSSLPKSTEKSKTLLSSVPDFTEKTDQVTDNLKESPNLAKAKECNDQELVQSEPKSSENKEGSPCFDHNYSLNDFVYETLDYQIEDRIDFDENNNNLFSSDQNGNTHFPLSRETMEVCLERPIPGDIFTAGLPRTTTFKLCSSQWERIKTLFSGHGNENPSARGLPRGSWQHFFIPGLKQSNPYCVLMFNRHRVSKKIFETPVSSTVPLFAAEGYCKFDSCPVTFKLHIFDPENVSVAYFGNIEHKIEEEHARPISGELRKEMQKHLADGPKPYKALLDRLHDVPSSVIVAGNCDDYGVSRSVLQKIGSEGRQLARKDKDAFTSLLLIAKDIESRTKDRRVPGFIQVAMAKPLCIMYWTEVGLRVYHELAKRDCLFWDATGSCVQKWEDQDVLYYELVCRNPIEGAPAIPVAAMLTVSRALNFVHFWLSSFRSHEQKLFGHSNQVQVRQINSDRALVFIVAALKEFNNENYKNFLDRAWRIVTGKASNDDLKRTNPHACVCHVMNSCKKLCLSVYRSNFKYGMYCFSALLHSTTLHEASTILRSMAFVLLSKTVTPELEYHINILKHKMENIPANADIEKSFTSKHETETDQELNELNPNRYTEEDYLSLNPVSSFHIWVERIITEVKSKLSADTTVSQTKNRLHGPTFLEKLSKTLLPTFPLWSNVLMGDLGRHGETEPYGPLKPAAKDMSSKTFRSNAISATSNATVEERFRIIKDIILQGRSTRRIDEFSYELDKHFSETERLVMKTIIKSRPQKIKAASTKSTQQISEGWNKKIKSSNITPIPPKMYQGPPRKRVKDQLSATNPSPQETPGEEKQFTSSRKLNIENKQNITKDTVYSQLPKIAKVEQPPKTTNKTSNVKQHTDQSLFTVSDITGLRNSLNNCWFNAILQAFSRTYSIMHCIDNMCDFLGSAERYRPVLKVANEILNGQSDPDLLEEALYLMNTIGFALNEFHDAHEFFGKVISPFMDYCGAIQETKMRISIACKACQFVSMKTETMHDILLSVPNEGCLSIRNLLRICFQAEIVRDYTCESCKKSVDCLKEQSLLSSPMDLVLVLRRYSVDVSNKLNKVKSEVYIDTSLKVCGTMYDLHSVVMHHGPNQTSGHYTTLLHLGGHNFVHCDDFRITKTSVIDQRTFRDCYIVVYKKRTESLSVDIKALLLCVSQTQAMKASYDLLVGLPSFTFRRRYFCELLESLLFCETPSEDFSALEKLSFILKSWEGYANEINSALEHIFSDFLFRYVPSALVRVFGIGLFALTCCSKCKRRSDSRLHCHIGSVSSFANLTTGDINTSIFPRTGQCPCGESIEMTIKPASLGGVIALESVGISGMHLLLSQERCIRLTLPVYTNTTLQYAPVCVCLPNGSQTKVVLLDPYPRVIDGYGRVTKVSSLQGVTDLAEGHTRIIMFFNKVQTSSIDRFKIIRASKMNELFVGKTTCIKIYNPDVTTSNENILLHFLDKFKVNKLQFEPADCERFIKGMLTDKCIDIYMQHLATTYETAKTSHFVPSAWFKCKVSDSECNTPQCSTYWYSKPSVLVPVNIDDSHWILVIISIQENLVFYIDPLGKFDRKVAKRLDSYLAFEYYRYHHAALDTSKLKFILLADAKDFPKQRDQTSCGIYVCLFAKCFFKMCLPISSCTDMKSYRQDLAMEIVQCHYLDVPNDKFTLKDVLLCDDVEDKIKAIMTHSMEEEKEHSQLPYYERHQTFIQNPVALSRKTLVGFGDQLVSDEQSQVIKEYLGKRYFKTCKLNPGRIYSPNIRKSIFDGATSLNNAMQKAPDMCGIYIDCVLWKEVVIFSLMKKMKMSYKDINEACIETEYS